MTMNMSQRASIFLLMIVLVACNPTVKIKNPDQPIVINMNLKIDHELRIKLEQEVSQMIQSNPDIF